MSIEGKICLNTKTLADIKKFNASAVVLDNKQTNATTNIWALVGYGSAIIGKMKESYEWLHKFFDREKFNIIGNKRESIVVRVIEVKNDNLPSGNLIIDIPGLDEKNSFWVQLDEEDAFSKMLTSYRLQIDSTKGIRADRLKIPVFHWFDNHVMDSVPRVKADIFLDGNRYPCKLVLNPVELEPQAHLKSFDDINPKPKKKKLSMAKLIHDYLTHMISYGGDIAEERIAVDGYVYDKGGVIIIDPVRQDKTFSQFFIETERYQRQTVFELFEKLKIDLFQFDDQIIDKLDSEETKILFAKNIIFIVKDDNERSWSDQAAERDYETISSVLNNLPIATTPSFNHK